MDKLGKLWWARFAGTALTAVVAASAVAYFSGKDVNKTSEPNTNCETRTMQAWQQYKSICEPSPKNEDAVEKFYQNTKKELQEEGCDTKCLEWTCMIEYPDGEYKARERAYCIPPF